MLVVGKPLRLHVLYLLAVTQHNLVELRRVQYGEVQCHRTFRHVADKVHACLKPIAECRHHDVLHHVAARICKHRAYEVRARHARPAHLLVARHVHHAHRITVVRTEGVCDGVLAAHHLASAGVATLCLLDVLQGQHIRIRHARHVVLVPETVARVVLVVQEVIDALAPEERLIHHPVALRAVKFRRRAVRVLVAVRIVQLAVSHLAVQVVHHGVHIGDVHVPCRGFLCHLRQHSVPVLEDDLYVAARLVVVAVLVARAVVQVRDVRVVSHAFVALQHRVFRLHDVQFREVLLQGLVLLVALVSCQAVGAHQSAGVHVAAVLVHAARRHQRGQQAAVVLRVYARHAQVSHVGTLPVDGSPVQVRATVHHKPCDIVRTLQRQSAVGQFAQVAQFQGLESCRQCHIGQRCALCEVHARQRRLARLQRL